MAALRTGPGVDPPMLLAEEKLPAPFRRGVGVFAGERIGQLHASIALREVALVEPLHPFEMVRQRPFGCLGQHGDPILEPFPVSDSDLILCEIEVVNPQAQAFHQSQPRPVHQAGHEPLVPVEVAEESLHLLPG